MTMAGNGDGRYGARRKVRKSAVVNCGEAWTCDGQTYGILLF